jgi:hypothetical protein
MSTPAEQKAEVLLEALPYIQKFRGIHFRGKIRREFYG